MRTSSAKCSGTFVAQYARIVSRASSWTRATRGPREWRGGVEVAALGVGGREVERLAVRGRGLVVSVEAAEQIGTRSRAAGGSRRARPTLRARRRCASPASGPSAIADRDRAVELDDRRRDHAHELAVERGDLDPVGRRPRSARSRGTRRSRPAPGTDRAARAGARRRAASTPSAISSASHRVRSCSSSGTRSPCVVDARRRAGRRAAASSASRPSASGSSGISSASVRASRIASAQRSARTSSAPAVADVALVEQQVEHARAPRRCARAAGARAARGTGCRRCGSCASPARGAAPSSARARGTRARSRRWSARRACAASARPAPRAASAGWQQVKIRRSRSSSTPLSSTARRRRRRPGRHSTASTATSCSLAAPTVGAAQPVERAVARRSW